MCLVTHFSTGREVGGEEGHRATKIWTHSTATTLCYNLSVSVQTFSRK